VGFDDVLELLLRAANNVDFAAVDGEGLRALLVSIRQVRRVLQMTDHQPNTGASSGHKSNFALDVEDLAELKVLVVRHLV